MGTNGTLGVRDGTTMLAVGERPWPSGWEWERTWDKLAGPKDPAKRLTKCSHEWERAYVTSTDGAANEIVIRCHHCTIPRCGDSTDEDPCMLRRHHRGSHAYYTLVGLGLPNLNDRDAIERWLVSD